MFSLKNKQKYIHNWTISNRKLLISSAVLLVIAAIAGLLLLVYEPPIELSVKVWPAEAGSVSSTGGIFEPGAKVTLTATSAGSEYVFSHWEGEDTNSVSRITIITMNESAELTAFFVRMPDLDACEKENDPYYY